MTKRKRYLLCGHGESLPMAEDGTTSLSSVLEELAVEVCAEAVSARRCVNEEHFDFVWVSCCEGAEPINLAAACKRDSPQTAVYLVTADRTGSVASRAQAAELDGIVGVLESNTLELEESLASYERGVKLLAALQGRLSQAQQKVDVLMGELVADADDAARDTSLS